MTLEKRDYDVVVVGAGGGGMSAAITAHDAGASVLLVEVGDAVGGSTALSGGFVYAAGTSVQRAAGILHDSAEAMFAYYMTLNQWKVDPAVAWRYCTETAVTLEWLLELGVEFPVANLHAAGVDGVPRSHEAVGEGRALVAVLERSCRERHIDIALGQRVDGLIQDSDGAVVGVTSGADQVSAAGVIFATGGFGHNRDLLQQYYPDAADAGDWCWSVSGRHAMGDGLVIGRGIGASISGYNRGLLLPTTGMDRVFETPLPSWLMLVNAAGMRFVDENAPHPVITGVIRAQRGPVHAIFDEEARQHGGPHPENVRCERSSNFTPDAIIAGVTSGVVRRATTLAALGAELRLEPGALGAAANRQNHHVARRRDSEFFKAPQCLREVSAPPFYAVEVKPAIISFTGCGLKIDPDARVLDLTGTPIRGLFAGGEVTGSVHGKRYLGGGNGLGNCLNFGRIAGATAAEYARLVGV
jgi:fumarate reductase flavoprotein subunit